MHYINMSLGMESNCHLFVVVVRTDNETKSSVILILPFVLPLIRSVLPLGEIFFLALFALPLTFNG